MNAFEWIRQGWAIFLVAPAFWLTVGFGLLLFFGLFEFMFVLIQIALPPGMPRQVLSAFFLFGPVLVMPLVAAGGVNVCRRLADGQAPRFADLAWGFAERRSPLLALGGLFLAGWLGLFLFYVVVKGPLALFLPTLAGFAFLMAIWFMPVLVAFHGMPVLGALRAGFGACLGSFGTFLVFGFVMMLLHFLALLPLALGLPILFPVVIGALYASYRDVFPES